MNNDQDRRVLTAVVLMLAVWSLWAWWAGPSTPPEAPATAEAPAAPATPAAVPGGAPPALVDTTPCVDALVPFDGERVGLGSNPCSGGVRRLEMIGRLAPIEVTPWWLWLWKVVSFQNPGEWTAYGQNNGAERLLTDQGVFGLAGAGAYGRGGAWTVTPGGAGLRMERLGVDGLRVVQELAATDEPDRFTLRVRWEATTGTVNGPFWVGVEDRLADIGDVYDLAPRLEAVVDGDLESQGSPSEIPAAGEALEGPVSWVGLADRYFLAALTLPEGGWGELKWVRNGEFAGAYVHATEVGQLSPGTPLEATFAVYAGPKDVERLAELGGGLEEAASLGIFGFFSKVLLFFLHLLHAGFANWGVAIIGLTVLVRAAFYPLSASAYRSAKAMQALQPKLKELQETFKDDRDAQTRETMKLFQENKVNPLSGCLPILVQMPVFFALYSALLHTPDLYHADFLYVRDLSMPDPFGVFPILMVIGMVFQQRLTPMTGMDPTQAQMMKIMPLLFGLFMFQVPAGLSLYYVVNTALAILQQWYNTRSYEAGKPAAA